MNNSKFCKSSHLFLFYLNLVKINYLTCVSSPVNTTFVIIYGNTIIVRYKSNINKGTSNAAPSRIPSLSSIDKST